MRLKIKMHPYITGECELLEIGVRNANCSNRKILFLKKIKTHQIDKKKMRNILTLLVGVQLLKRCRDVK